MEHLCLLRHSETAIPWVAVIVVVASVPGMVTPSHLPVSEAITPMRKATAPVKAVRTIA
mgnify:CR=1 FL=1